MSIFNSSIFGNVFTKYCAYFELIMQTLFRVYCTKSHWLQISRKEIKLSATPSCQLQVNGYSDNKFTLTYKLLFGLIQTNGDRFICCSNLQVNFEISSLVPRTSFTLVNK